MQYGKRIPGTRDSKCAPPRMFAGSHRGGRNPKRGMGEKVLRSFKSYPESTAVPQLVDGFPGGMRVRADKGVAAQGVNMTNQPNTYYVDLDPCGYSSINSLEEFSTILPLRSLCFRYVPAREQPIANTGILYTLGIINCLLAKEKPAGGDNMIAKIAGRKLLGHWKYAGVLMHLSQEQEVASGYKIVRATLCYHGPTEIYNIFHHTQANFTCGLHLFLVLRRLPKKDSTKVKHLLKSMEMIDNDDVGESLDTNEEVYWQLQPVTSSDKILQFHMYNGPDFNGAYFRVGVVQKRFDGESNNPGRLTDFSLQASHPHTAGEDATDHMFRLPMLPITVCGIGQ